MGGWREGTGSRWGGPLRTWAWATAGAMLAVCTPARVEAADVLDQVRGHAGWSQESCASCHPPAGIAGEHRPGWNDAVPGGASYPVFAGRDGFGSAGPGPISLVCLSCHDGTIGRGGMGGARTHVDADLTNDHPVGVVYAAARPGLHDPRTQPSGFGGTIATDLLAGGRVECTSCHRAHGGHAPSGSAIGTSLCLTCHDK